MRLDAVVLALVAVAWLPANHYFPWGSAWQEGLALLALGAGASLLGTRVAVPWPWLAIMGLAWVSVVGQLATGLLLFSGDAWMVVIYLGAFALAVGAGGTLVVHTKADASTERLELLCLALLLAAVASAGIGLAQWAGVQNLGIFGAELAPGRRPYANFGQPNHWCTASFVGLGAAWTLYESRRLGSLTFALIAAMLLAAMVVSGSRTGWLQLGLGLGLLLLLRRRIGLRLPLQAVGLALALVAVAWLIWPWLNADASVGTARSLTDQARAGVRLPLWTAMLDAIAERPWTGYGWQQMVLAQQAVALDGPPLQRHFEHAHNLPLDLVLWAGVPVGLAIIALAGWALLRLVAGTRDPRAAGVLLAVGGVLVHSMVEYAIEYAYFLLPLALLLGAAHQLARTPSLALPLLAGRMAGGTLLAALALTGIDYLKAEQSYRMLRLELARIGVARVESTTPGLRVLNQLESFLEFSRREPRAGATVDELEFARKVSLRYAQPGAQYRYARWQALNGDTAGATRTLKLLCAMHAPTSCLDAAAAWLAAQAADPALLAVPVPTLPR